MPPTRPIAGYRTLYSKDPTTGELYAIGIAPPPSPFIADGVEPAVLPVDFIWGDTSQVTPVGSAPFLIDQLGDVDTSTVAPAAGDTLRFDGTNWVPAVSVGGDEAFVGDVDPRVTDPTSTVELWQDTSVTPTVLKYWNGTAWVAAVTHPTPPTNMRRQTGLAITAGSWYHIMTLSSGGGSTADYTVAANSGSSTHIFHGSSLCYANGAVGMTTAWGSTWINTKLFDRVAVKGNTSGYRLCIRAAATLTINIGWELRDVLAGSPMTGNATFALDTTSTGEVGAAAL